LDEKDFAVVGRSWFPPNMAAKLTLKTITSELLAIGVKRPQRCGMKDSLILLGKELLRNNEVTIKKATSLSRMDVNRV